MGDTQSEKELPHRAAPQTEFGRVQRTSNRELSIENEDLDAGRPSVSRRDVPGDESRLGAVYVWGDEFAPGERMMANTWQGEFPW